LPIGKSGARKITWLPPDAVRMRGASTGILMPSAASEAQPSTVLMSMSNAKRP
jgi:hypothetical protein